MMAERVCEGAQISSINSAANHQPVLVAVAQHGAIDDHVYFTVGKAGGDAANAAATAAAGNTGDDNNGGNGGNAAGATGEWTTASA